MEPRRDISLQARRTVAVSLAACALWQALRAVREPDLLHFQLAIAATTCVAAVVVWFVPLPARRRSLFDSAGEPLHGDLGAMDDTSTRRRVLLVVAGVSAVITLSVVFFWSWEPRIDFDMVGFLWLLTNSAPITLVAAFGTVALASIARWAELTLKERWRSR